MKIPNTGPGNPNLHRKNPDHQSFGRPDIDASLNGMLNFNSDGSIPQYHANSYMGGGPSTVPSALNQFDIHDLHKQLSGVTQGSRVTNDQLGRQIIEVTQGFGDKRSVSHIHLDQQTGALSVNNANNPSGGFFITDQITNLRPFEGQQFSNKKEFLDFAVQNQVFQPKVDVLRNAISGGMNVVSMAQRSAVASLQDEGSPFTSYNPAELSPQMRVKMATSIGLPTMLSNDDGTFRKAYGSDYTNFLNNTGASAFYGSKGSSSRLIDLEAFSGANYPQIGNGMFDMNKPKRDTQQGVRETLAYFNNPSPTGQIDAMTSPFRMSGSPSADQGYKQNYLYTLHNVLTPEGQGFIRENAGLQRRAFSRTIDLPEGGAGALGIAANTLYGGLSPAEGQQYGGDAGRLEQLLGKRFGSYQGVSVDNIQIDGNRATISGGAYIPMTGTSRKFKQKGIVASTPDASGIIPNGYDVVMAAPDAKDIAGIGQRALAARYDSTAEFGEVFKAYATGYENISAKRQQWVDQNASWIRGASGAGGTSANQAGKLFNNGVIGGENGDVFARMTRDYAMSQMSVHEWNDQYIDASTYNMHKDAMVGGQPMLENVSLHSGQGSSAIYKVGTYRDNVISTEVMDQMQPEFARSEATLKSESLDRMARYQPQMYDYLRRVDQAGGSSNPARDIVTATRANYENGIGTSARAQLSGNRSVINLDENNYGLNLSDIHAGVTSEMQGLSSDEIDQEFLKRVSNVTGDHALQVGGYILPSAKAALSTYTIGPDGQAIGNLGSKMAKTLVAQGNVQTAAQLGGGEDFTKARNMGAYETIQEAADLISPSNPNDSAKEFMRSATGIKAPIVAGSAIASKAVPLGTTVIDENELYRVSGARSVEERQQILAHVNKGTVGVLNTMYPEANNQNASIRNRVMTTQQFNKAMGSNVLSTENKMYVNEGTAFALSKDFDGDTIQGLLSGRFVGEGDNRRLVKAEGWKSQTAGEINDIIESSVGGEIGKQREKAAVTADDYRASAGQIRGKSLGDIGSGYLETAFAKMQMGPMYNMGIRMFNQVANVLSDRAGFGQDSTEARRTQRAMSGFSQSFYQAAIDLEATSDPALQRLSRMSKTLNQESSKSPYNSNAFYAEEGKGVEIKGGGNKTTLAGAVMETFADVGLDPNAEDRHAAAEKYRKYIAPHLAVGMSPLNATADQRASAEQMLMSHANAYERGEDQRLNTSAFAKAVGKNNQAHWLYGSQGEGLEAAVPLAATMAGNMGIRLDEKNPDRQGAKIGLQSVYQGVVQQVRNFFGGDSSRNFEDYAQSVASQAPEVTPHTQYAIEQMGGTGVAGSNTRDLLSHLDPNTVSAPVEDHYDEQGNAYDTSGEVIAPEQGTATPSPVRTSAAPLRAAGGRGSGRKPPRATAAPATEPPSQPPSNIGGNNTTIVNKNIIAGLKQNDVKRAFGSLQYLQNNQQDIGELTEFLSNGGDFGQVSGRVDAIIKASSSVQGVYNSASQRRAAGLANQPADQLATPLFDPGSGKHYESFTSQNQGDIDKLLSAQTTYRLDQMESRKAKTAAVPAELGADEIGTATAHMQKFVANMSQLSEIMEGVNKGQGTYIQQSKELIKSYDTMASASAAIVKRGDNATPEEKAFLASAQGAGLEWRKDSINELKNKTAFMEASGQVKPIPMDENERQDQLMGAIMRGGVGGSRARRKASDAGLYEGGLDFLGINVDGENNVNALGGAMRLAGHARNMLWASSHIQNQIIAPMQAQADFYGQRQDARDTLLVQTGGMSYDQMMSGATGAFRRRQANGVIAQEEAGRQIFNTYNGLASAFGGEQWGRLQGAASSVVSPALSVGVLATQLGYGAAALPAMLGVGAVAGASWLNQASHDDATVMNVFKTGLKASRTPGVQGMVEATRDLFKDPAGLLAGTWSMITDPNNAKRQKNLAQMQNDLEDSMGLNGGRAHILSDAQGGGREYVTNTLAQRYGVTAAVVNSAAFDSYRKDAANRGISEQTASNIFGFNQTYGKGFANEGVAHQLEKLESSGFTGITDQIGAIAASQGKSSTDISGMLGVAGGITNYLNSLPAGTNKLIEMGRINNTTSRNQNVNYALRMAGLPQRDGVFYGGMRQFADDPDQQDTKDTSDTGIAGLAFQSDQFASFFGGKTLKSFSARQTALIGQRNFKGAAREMSQLQDSAGMFEQYATYGAGDDVMGALYQSSTLGESDRRKFKALASGDKLALSQNYKAMGGIQYQLMDTTTGLDPFHDNISAEEYAGIKSTDRFGRFNISQAEAAGGVMGMQDKMLTDSRNMDTLQFQQQQYQRGLSYGMMTGGGSLNKQGFVQGGDNLAGVAAIFQANGMQFNPGNGMSQWQIQDASTAMSHQQQLFSMQQEGQNLNIQQQQFTNQGQQWNASHNLQVAQFNYNTAYTGQQMDIDRSHQVTQQSWQQEDLSYNRNVSEVQFGFQMRDFDRNIRYSRGRDRLDLMRQKDDTTILHSMEMGQDDKQQSRFDQQKKWSDDQFTRDKDHFTQTTAFQKQQLDMDKKNFEQDRELDKKRLEMSQDAHIKQMGWMTEGFKLEEQGRLIDRQSQILQNNMANDMSIKVRQLQLEQNKYTDAINVSNEALNKWNASISLNAANGNLAVTAIDALNGKLTTLAITANNIANSTSSTYQSPDHVPGGGYDIGGYTGYGAKNEVAGVAHRGEYIIPRDGVPVVRGDDSETIRLLTAIHATLQSINKNPAIVNATINTNQQRVSMRDALSLTDSTYGLPA